MNFAAPIVWLSGPFAPRDEHTSAAADEVWADALARGLGLGRAARRRFVADVCGRQAIRRARQDQV